MVFCDIWLFPRWLKSYLLIKQQTSPCWKKYNSCSALLSQHFFSVPCMYLIYIYTRNLQFRKNSSSVIFQNIEFLKDCKKHMIGFGTNLQLRYSKRQREENSLSSVSQGVVFMGYLQTPETTTMAGYIFSSSLKEKWSGCGKYFLWTYGPCCQRVFITSFYCTAVWCGAGLACRCFL